MSALRSGLRLLAGAAAILSSLGSGVSAQETTPPAPGGLAIELNTANDVEGGCRLAFVAQNGTDTALDAVSYELVFFDAGQRISQFVLLEFGALPRAKTKIVQFDLAKSQCADISRIVINAASRCEAAGAALPICLDAARPTSRTSIALGL